METRTVFPSATLLCIRDPPVGTLKAPAVETSVESTLWVLGQMVTIHAGAPTVRDEEAGRAGMKFLVFKTRANRKRQGSQQGLAC